MNKEVKQEAKDYFGRKAFQRLFFLFKDKIESLGYTSGTVKIEPTDEEKAVIEIWMEKKIKAKTITVSLTRFEKKLAGTKFEELTLWEIVELVTEKPIIPKKERKARNEERRKKYFSELYERFTHPNAQIIIRKMENKEKGAYGLISLYNDKDFQSIETILKAVSNFPAEDNFERLPVFAEHITGDPHYFDKNKRIYQAIEMLIAEKENREYRGQITAVDETELLSLVNLDKDDLHSFVTIYGLEAYRSGDLIKQWHWANIERNVQNIPLRSLRSIDTIKPLKGNKVYILENSGVYSSLIDKLDSVYPVVCTHGNIKLSGILLLDKLIKSGAKLELYYSGDLDVNGISIARRLKRRFGSNLYIWRMGVEEYSKSVSNVEISTASLRKLDLNETDDFYEVVKEMKKIKKAGYQEPLIQEFITDILTFSINKA